MTNEDILTQRTLDVSKLPSTVYDAKSLLWWGNTWGLTIETVVFGILLAVYFTVRISISQFLPPRTTPGLPVLYDPFPDVVFPTTVLIVFLLSLIPAVWLDVSARRRDVAAMKTALLVTLTVNLVLIALRYFEFDSLHFKWNDNAYGSITWTILGMHMIHLVIMAAEDTYLLIWGAMKGIDEKHALDITVAATYWYWIVGTWVILYLIVFWSPRFL